MEGIQEVRVQAVTPPAGPGHGQIAIRLARVLIYLNDREALDSLLDASLRASEFGDEAFGIALRPRRTSASRPGQRTSELCRAPADERGPEQ